MTSSRERLPTRGRPILFIHGLLHGAWCWSDPWREYFNRRGLAAEVVDLPGHGGTCAATSSQRWTALTDYADALVDRVAGFDPAPILVGHSLGALLIQMRLRQLKPPAVVLLAPTHPAAFRWSVWRHFRRNPRLFLRVHRHGRPRLAIPSAEECREWFFCDSTPEDVVARCFARLEEESYRVCLEMLLRPKVVWRAHAGTPVLVLGAAQDRSVPRQVTEWVAELHGMRAEFFGGVGHDLMLEPGWERVAGRIIRWLRELGLAPRPGTRAVAPPWVDHRDFQGDVPGPLRAAQVEGRGCGRRVHHGHDGEDGEDGGDPPGRTVEGAQSARY